MPNRFKQSDTFDFKDFTGKEHSAWHDLNTGQMFMWSGKKQPPIIGQQVQSNIPIHGFTGKVSEYFFEAGYMGIKVQPDEKHLDELSECGYGKLGEAKGKPVQDPAWHTWLYGIDLK